MDKELYMVCDVESVGLHGEGFAAGYVVVEWTGRELGATCYVCPSSSARGSKADRSWLHAHMPILEPTLHNPQEVREAFWTDWLLWQAKGARLAADVPWPVEANFLSACVAQYQESRSNEAPYPLIDVASVRLAVGLDPLATVERLPGELPLHNPVADARHSARLLIEALAIGRRV